MKKFNTTVGIPCMKMADVTRDLSKVEKEAITQHILRSDDPHHTMDIVAEYGLGLPHNKAAAHISNVYNLTIPTGMCYAFDRETQYIPHKGIGVCSIQHGENTSAGPYRVVTLTYCVMDDQPSDAIYVSVYNPMKHQWSKWMEKGLPSTGKAGQILYTKEDGSYEWMYPGKNASVPVGMVGMFPFDFTSEEWIKADGRSLEKAQYPDLYKRVGDAYGNEDNLHFNIIDMRGYFVRAVDDGKGIDAGRVVGSTQDDAIRNITGTFGLDPRNAYDATGAFYLKNEGSCEGISASVTSGVTGFDASRVVPTADENRPKNIALAMYIKVRRSPEDIPDGGIAGQVLTRDPQTGLMKWVYPSGTPIGMVMWCTGDKAPLGMIPINVHQRLRIKDYPALFKFAQASGNIITEHEWNTKATQQGSVPQYWHTEGSAFFGLPYVKDYIGAVDTGDPTKQLGDWKESNQIDVDPDDPHDSTSMTPNYASNYLSPFDQDWGKRLLTDAATDILHPRTSYFVPCIKAYDTLPSTVDLSGGLPGQAIVRKSDQSIGWGNVAGTLIGQLIWSTMADGLSGTVPVNVPQVLEKDTYPQLFEQVIESESYVSKDDWDAYALLHNSVPLYWYDGGDVFGLPLIRDMISAADEDKGRAPNTHDYANGLRRDVENALKMKDGETYISTSTLSDNSNYEHDEYLVPQGNDMHPDVVYLTPCIKIIDMVAEQAILQGGKPGQVLTKLDNGSVGWTNINEAVGQITYASTTEPLEGCIPVNVEQRLSKDEYPDLFEYMRRDGTYLTHTEWLAEKEAQGSVGHYWWDGEEYFGTPLIKDYICSARGIDGEDVGDYNSDAIRNITGSITHDQEADKHEGYWTVADKFHSEGALKAINQNTNDGIRPDDIAHDMVNASLHVIEFDASRSVPTAHENRPKTLYFMPCVRAVHSVVSASSLKGGKVGQVIMKKQDGTVGWGNIAGSPVGQITWSSFKNPLPGTLPINVKQTLSIYDYPQLFAAAKEGGNIISRKEWTALEKLNKSVGQYWYDGGTVFGTPLVKDYVCASRNTEDQMPGDYASDAIRNITGTITHDQEADELEGYWTVADKFHSDGALKATIKETNDGIHSNEIAHDMENMSLHTIEMDASNSVPTASENRPKTVFYIPCIKAFDFIADPSLLVGGEPGQAIIKKPDGSIGWGSVGVPLGQVVWSSTQDPLPGTVPINTPKVLNRRQYPGIFEIMQRGRNYVTHAKWDELHAVQQSVGHYWWDGDDEFGLPLIKDYVCGARNTDDIGKYTGDAIRNVTGTVRFGTAVEDGCSGPFSVSEESNNYWVGQVAPGRDGVDFDLSKSVPTASENRPKTVYLLPCLKVYDEIFSSALMQGGMPGQVIMRQYDGTLDWGDVTGWPIGMVFYWPALVPPDGSLVRNGILVKRMDYPDLFNMAKTSGNIITDSEWLALAEKQDNVPKFSYGDGQSTFRIPLDKNNDVDHNDDIYLPCIKAFDRACDLSVLRGGEVGDVIMKTPTGLQYVHSRLYNNEKYTIGPSGDYHTVNEALVDLQDRRPLFFSDQNDVHIELELQSNYVWNEQVFITNIDMRHFKITSENNVTIHMDASCLHTGVMGTDKPFLFGRNSHLPNIHCSFIIDKPSDTNRDIAGIWIDGGLGILNMVDCSIVGATHYGVVASSGSMINAIGCTFNDDWIAACITSDSRGSFGTCTYKKSNYGALIDRSSCHFSKCYFNENDIGLGLANASRVALCEGGSLNENRIGCIASDSMLSTSRTIPIDILNNSENGLRSDSSVFNVYKANIVGSTIGFYNFNARGRLFESTVSNCSVGVEAASSNISVDAATSFTSCSIYALQVWGGGIINNVGSNVGPLSQAVNTWTPQGIIVR